MSLSVPSFVTREQYDRTLDVPISLPQTLLDPGLSIVVNAFDIPDGATMQIRWLCLHFVRASTTSIPTKINNGRQGVSAGLYGDSGLYTNELPGSAMAGVSTDFPNTAVAMPVSFPFAAKSPGTYALVVQNNFSCRVEVVVTASLRITLAT